MQAQIEYTGQAGPQRQFLESRAEVVFYGGAAGGGKTFACLLESARNYNVPGFGAVFFRRTMPQITREGGVWDEAMSILPKLGAKPRMSPRMRFRWPSGATVAFDQLQYENTIHDYQGSQICLLLFDQLEQFSERQFWYMFSRNRSTCGIRPYIRGTVNPDPDSWVADFIAWWINQETGYPIPERAGVVRFFVRLGTEVVWADTREELDQYRPPDMPADLPFARSFTFIPAQVTDNRILMERDPAYYSRLTMLDDVDRERLLKGNWKIRLISGLLFNRGMFEVVDSLPDSLRLCRGWDRAATDEKKAQALGRDADFTAGFLLGKSEQGQIFLADLVHGRWSPGAVEGLIRATAMQDGYDTEIATYKDPGSAGVYESDQLVRVLDGFDVTVYPASNLGGKVAMAKPLSAQATHGNVIVIRGPWNRKFFGEAEGFPDGPHDDMIDAASVAHRKLSEDTFYMAG